MPKTSAATMPMDAPAPTTEELLERVRGLVPAIRERAAEGDANRAIPKESVQEFLDIGLARVLLPKKYGGWELGMHAWVDVILEIAAADASHGWCAHLIMHHPHYVAQFPEAAQEYVWADGPDKAIAAALTPMSQVEREDGGYRLTGEIPFASGISHSTWTMAGALIPDDDGNPGWNLFILAPGQFEVRDTWHTIGMRGTGSNTVVFKDVFVPDEYFLRVADMREGMAPGGALHEGNHFRAPWVTYASLGFVSPMLGAAKGALEDLRVFMSEARALFGSPVAEFTSIQVRLARAATDLEAAEFFLRRCADTAELPEPASLEIRARSYRDCCRASELIVDAMEAIMKMAGARGFTEDSPIQRAWRDVHFASTHVSLNPEISFAAWGRQQLGLERDPGQQMF